MAARLAMSAPLIRPYDAPYDALADD
jgi:hypothetical protein